MSSISGHCEVRMKPSPNGCVIAVYALSIFKEGFKSKIELYATDYDSQSSLMRAVEISGGAAAEYLCDKYAEPFDPSMVAKDAKKAFYAECLAVGEASKTAGQKFKLLNDLPNYIMDTLFTDKEINQYHRAEYLFNEQDTISLVDATLLNKMVAGVSAYGNS